LIADCRSHALTRFTNAASALSLGVGPASGVGARDLHGAAGIMNCEVRQIPQSDGESPSDPAGFAGRLTRALTKLAA
jgi:hypothetical protein